MTNKQIISALQKYKKLNEELFNYTREFYDTICYDIEGYWDTIHEIDNWFYSPWNETIDTKALQNQIKSVQKLIKGYELFSPTYG